MMVRYKAIWSINKTKQGLIIWVGIEGLSEEYIEEAKAIDDRFNILCFGCCISFDEKGMNIEEDEDELKVFYMTMDGEQHYLGYELSEEEEESICKETFKEIANRIK